MKVPDATSEERLAEIRRAAQQGTLAGTKSYYALPLLKAPVWTWEVPLYFFVGGAAGASAAIGFAARITGGDMRLIRDARRFAAIGAAISAPLLIADLGRPERFLNMLRVFKPQSPMSVGAWLVAAFGGVSTAAAILPGRIADAASAASALTGLGMATYTGVLIGATSVPVWARHARLLPFHFAASALGSATSMLELRGHRTGATNALGITAAAAETATGVFIEWQRDRVTQPLRQGTTGTLMRAAGVLSGPLPLLIRLAAGRSKKMRRLAAAATIAGSLITRFAWIEAGRRSTSDPKVALGSRRGDAARARGDVGKRAPGGEHRGQKPDSADQD